MANRMQKEIIPLIHQNQYGFIKRRNIQDCLGWAFEYLHICHLSKRPIIILKIDFEKAFDKVDHNAVIAMLKARGFGPKWIKLIYKILHSASTSVLLNGVPGKKIICKRGVRQGDPQSPILFVNTADLLQSFINKAWKMDLLIYQLWMILVRNIQLFSMQMIP
jgi:retron-type reverse transcriptase